MQADNDPILFGTLYLFFFHAAAAAARIAFLAGPDLQPSIRPALPALPEVNEV